VLARLESEGLAPLINRCFNLMWRAKEFPDPPQELQGQQLDIEYEGPLARSQKASRLAGFEEFTRLTEPMVARNLTIADNMDEDYAYRDLGDVAGLPTKYFKNESDVARMRERRQAKQAIDEKVALAGQAAEMAGKIAPAAKLAQENGNGGAPPDLSALMEQMNGAGAPSA
jgi:hypothetical protein